MMLIATHRSLLSGSKGNPYLLQDLFAGTNSTNLAAHTMNVGSGWTTQSGGFQLNGSGQAIATGTGLCLDTANAGASDADVSVTLNLSTLSPFSGIVGRYQDINNHWLLVLDNGEFALYEVVGGTATEINRFSMTTSTSFPYTVRFLFQGPALYGFLNGVLDWTWLSSDFQTQTRFGVRNNISAACTYSNFFALPVNYVNSAKGVLVAGDSISTVIATGCQIGSYGMFGLMNLTPHIANEAVAGSTIASVSSRQTADAATLNGFGVSQPILSLMIGTNDSQGSVTPAQLLSSVQTYFQTMKGLVSGLKTILWPIPICTNPTVATFRDTYNPLIVTAAGSNGIDVVVDPTTNNTLYNAYWTDTNSSDPTKVVQSGGAAGHPTDLTQQFGIAPYFAAAFAAA
jgi:hypothetical protein